MVRSAELCGRRWSALCSTTPLYIAARPGVDGGVLRWVRRAALVLLPGCFHPIYDHPACSHQGECPPGLRCSAALVCESGSTGTPVDAPAGDGSGGSGAAPNCFAHWMDGSIDIDPASMTEITELSSGGQEQAPWISSDGLRIYFSRDLTPPLHGDVYFASRSASTGLFGAAMPVTNLNSPGQENRAWLTTDELTLALSTAHDGPLDIHMTTRSAGQPFGSPSNTHLAAVNTTGTARFDPFLTDDLLRLYFSANTGPVNRFQMWIATRATASDDFGTPSLVPGFDEPSLNELVSALYQNERLLLFSSLPNGATADLYYATRSSATDSFGPAARIPTVNTGSSETEPVLSADGCELYFVSDRDAGGGFHLFHARVTR